MEAEMSDDWIDRYNNDELDEYEKALFENKMLADPLLRSEVYIDACLNRFLMDFELQDLMKKIRAASRKNSGGKWLLDIFLMIASILVLSSIFGVFYLVRSSAETTPVGLPKYAGQEGQKVQVDSGKRNVIFPGDQRIPKDLTKNNFESLAEYEVLVGTGSRSDQFKLISPNVNVSIHIGTEIKFVWQSYNKQVPLYLVILNNHGITVSKVALNQVSSFNLKTKGFKSGLYYWKMMAEEKMVVMGKFTVL